MQDYPTPQGVTCETPRGIDVPESPCTSERTQEQDSEYGPADRAATHAPRSVGGTIDEGPFRLSLNQSSTADLTSFVKAALEVDKDGNEEEAEWGLRDALSCSSRLLSPTHAETVKIGYTLASFYARRRKLVDADDILNWMTNKHLGSLGVDHPKTINHVFCIISLLRHWLRNGEADLLIYRLLESQQNPEGHPVIPQISTALETVSKEMTGELLASVDEDRLAIFLVILERLADGSENHKFLQDLMPQIIERCDSFQQTHSSLAIQSRCILAEILVDGAQYERARSILRGSGRPLKHKVDSNSLLELETLKLVQRVAITFLRADNPEMCDRVIERVVTEFDTSFAVKSNRSLYIILIDFLISTAFEIQKKCEWQRIRPRIERALSLSYSLFGRHRQPTEQIERMLETHNVEPLNLLAFVRGFHDYIGSALQ